MSLTTTDSASSSGYNLNTSKTITTLGSIFLFVNNTIGPGLVLLPALYQEAGWLPSAFCSILLCVMSYLIGIMLTKAIRIIPHNKHDDLRIEYLDLIQYYMGFHSNPSIKNNISMKLCQLMYILFMMAFLIGSLIQTCQTFDLAIARIFGNSFGFIYFPFHVIGFTKNHCIDSISPFACNDNGNAYTLSIGTLIIYIFIIPFCMKNLSEAIWIQYVGTYGTILLIMLWCVMLSFSAEFDVENVPVATTSIYQTLGINFYNIAFLCTFPSWLNEKKQYVSPKKVLSYVCIVTAFCFIFVGYFGGISFDPYYKTTGDLLSKLNHFEPNKHISSPELILFFRYIGPISCYIYPILQCLSGIPVFATIIRYNLINTHILRHERSANIVAIWIPFILAIFLYHGDGFNFILNWSGVIFASFINFVLPVFFYYKSLLRPQSEWSEIAFSKHHKSLLDRSNIEMKHIQDTDVLLVDVEKTYSSCSSVGETDIGKQILLQKTRKVLYLFIFTILLALVAFCLDIGAIFR